VRERWRELDALRGRVRALTTGPGPEAQRYADDPVAFAQKALGLRLDDWQARVLAGAAERTIINASRQSGKSPTAAVLGLHQALYRAGSLTLLVSPSLRQSSELFRKVSELRDALPWKPELLEDNRLSMRVKGGGRVVSLPGSERTIRGHSAVTLLVVDEAARVEPELYFSTLPMLAVSRGRLLMMSTPWLRSGPFFEVWSSPDGWHREHVTVFDVPRIAPEWIEEQRRAMPELWFRCEFMGEFVDAEDAVFAPEVIDAALSDEVEPLFGDAYA
jgi:hypothetical protein